MQINGKVRARLTVPARSVDDELRDRAPGGQRRADHATDGRTIRKVVVAQRIRFGERGDFMSRPSGSDPSCAGGMVCVRVVRGTRAAGCGYSLAGRGSFLPAYITTIGIPTFE